MAKKDSVKKAIESIYSGDARGLRKHINEALVEKVRKALDKKEKLLAKSLINSTYSLQEDMEDPKVIKQLKGAAKNMKPLIDKLKDSVDAKDLVKAKSIARSLVLLNTQLPSWDFGHVIPDILASNNNEFNNTLTIGTIDRKGMIRLKNSINQSQKIISDVLADKDLPRTYAPEKDE